MTTYYIHQYPIGWEISNQPSLTRWPISHGPFRTEAEAEAFAMRTFCENSDSDADSDDE